jgi:hypothetical protein
MASVAVLLARSFPEGVLACPTVGGQAGTRTVVGNKTWTSYEAVGCEYNTVEFDAPVTDAELAEVRSLFLYGPGVDFAAQNRVWIEGSLTQAYCSGTSAACPPDAVEVLVSCKDGQCVVPPPLATCSQFLSTASSTCQAWAVTHAAEADTAKRAYCERAPEAVECQCLLRADDPVYEQGREGLADDQAHCWYYPCANASYFLRESTDAQTGRCEDICGVVLVNFENAEAPPATVTCGGGGARSVRRAPRAVEGGGDAAWVWWLLVGVLTLLGVLMVSLVQVAR